MIFTIIFTVVYNLLYLLVALLPTANPLPVVISSSVSYIFGFLWNFNFLVDVPTLYTILGLTLAFEVGVVLWHLLHWVLAKIPFLHIR